MRRAFSDVPSIDCGLVEKEEERHKRQKRPGFDTKDNLVHIEEAACRRVEDQTSALEDLRSRASFLLAGTVSVAAFFGGEVLARPDTIEGAALSALMAATGSALALALVLWPKKFAGGMQTFKLLKYYVDREGGPSPYPALLRDMAIFWERQFQRNRKLIERNNYYFIVGLFLLAEQIIFWIFELKT